MDKNGSITNNDCQNVINVIGNNTKIDINWQSSDLEVNTPGNQESQKNFIECCIPDMPHVFIGRDADVKQITSFLVKQGGCGIVNIVGGPGFGKSTVAVKVSHQLRNDHDISVIFSYLKIISTVSEVHQHLCHDVGINPGKNPKSSLMFWLRSIGKRKVVLVMDNIEQLLESNAKDDFIELMLTLRKNSQGYLQILTTSRIGFTEATVNHEIKQLDEIDSVSLLRKCCPDEEVAEKYLRQLATFCGFVPLALCIAGSIIPELDHVSELIEWLREKPMKALRNSDQCVQQAIDVSFLRLSGEYKRVLVCLSVFNGNFHRRSVEGIIKKDASDTQVLLRYFADQSLVQRSSKRFVIHSLIRRFLADHDQFQDEKVRAQGLMVNHFLKMCHSLTMACYSFNGFTTARKSLKEDIHNVQETLKICSQDHDYYQATNVSPIFKFLASSDIYKSSSWYFYNISWDLLPETVLKDFFKSCIKLAESRQEPTIGLTFQCLVADQEGRELGWKSSKYDDRMQGIMEAFHKYETELKAERSLFEFCYYFLARYDSNKPTNTKVPPDLPETDLDNNELSTIETSSKAYILMERGNLSKTRAEKVPYRGEKYFKYMERARSIYDRALEKAEVVLKDHELTCILHKLLGDLFLALHKNDDALKCYSDAIKLRKKLELDSNEAFVFLLKNYGACLYYLGRFEESVEILIKSRDIADKLADKHTVCKSRVYFVLAKVYRNWKPDCQIAAEYAKQAMEMKQLLNPYMVEKLKKIIFTAEENTAKSK